LNDSAHKNVMGIAIAMVTDELFKMAAVIVPKTA
jgi:hypothetical protein